MDSPAASARRHPVQALRALLLAFALLLGGASAAHADIHFTISGTPADATMTVTGGDTGQEISFYNSAGQTGVATNTGTNYYDGGGSCVSAGAGTGRFNCADGTGGWNLNHLVLKTGSGFDKPFFNGVCFTTMDIDLGEGESDTTLPACSAAVSITYATGSARDQLASYPGNAATMNISLGGGPDRLSSGDWNTGKVTVDGGPGDDRLDGGAGDDVINGGDGDDQISGHSGNDTIIGGAGDDKFAYDVGTNDPDAGSDDYSGGPGYDSIYYDGHASGVTVSGDDVANDGVSGEGDNLHSDVEYYSGTSFADTFTGSANPEKFEPRSGTDVVHGGGGDDQILGGSGDDALYGDDGNDTISGDEGNDTLDGGTGRDALTGDSANCNVLGCSGGNDTIRARDGLQDSVNCGLGADSAQVDSIDILSNDPYSACESIDTSAALVTNPGITPAGNTATTGTNGSASPATFTASVTGKPSPTKGTGVTVSCVSACTITATLGVSKSTAKKYKLGTKAVSIGSAKATLLAAGSKTLTIALTKAAKAKLRKVKKVTVTLTVAVKDAAGKTTTTTSSVTLKK